MQMFSLRHCDERSDVAISEQSLTNQHAFANANTVTKRSSKEVNRGRP